METVQSGKPQETKSLIEQLRTELLNSVDKHAAEMKQSINSMIEGYKGLDSLKPATLPQPTPTTHGSEEMRSDVSLAITEQLDAVENDTYKGKFNWIRKKLYEAKQASVLTDFSLKTEGDHTIVTYLMAPTANSKIQDEISKWIAWVELPPKPRQDR